MAIFGLISEGITDQIVIENILVGLLNDDEVSVDPLQPARDVTDEDLATSHGNWYKVFEYCQTQRFKDAVLNMDYVIIQLDADIFKTQKLPLEYQINLPPNVSAEETVTIIKEKIIDLIEREFYENHKQKIIFAISVDAIECWLLPIYYQNQTAKASKIAGCLKSLNERLTKEEGFSIDKKLPKYYRAASKKYQKHKEIIKLYALNPSLKIFVEDIQQIMQ